MSPRCVGCLSFASLFAAGVAGNGGARQSATEELADFFGESSEGGSDDGLQERRKVVKAINRSALASVNAARGTLYPTQPPISVL